MYIRNCSSSFIFFAYWDRRRLPAVGREDASSVGREYRNTQNQFITNYILVFFTYWQNSG